MKKYILIIVLLVAIYLPVAIMGLVGNSRLPSISEAAQLWCQIYADFFVDYPAFMFSHLAALTLAILWWFKQPRMLSALALIIAVGFASPAGPFAWMILSTLPYYF